MVRYIFVRERANKNTHHERFCCLPHITAFFQINHTPFVPSAAHSAVYRGIDFPGNTIKNHDPPTARRHHPDRTSHPRQAAPDQAGAHLPAGARALADRRPARRGQDHAGACAGQDARPAVPAHPVHQRHAARRHPRRLDLPARQRRVQVPCGTDLRADDPRRRSEPRHAQDAERAAGSDGRTPGHQRGRDAPAAHAVLRHRHAEPDQPDRHLSRCRNRSSTAS